MRSIKTTLHPEMEMEEMMEHESDMEELKPFVVDSNDNNTSIVINDNNNTVGSINNTTPSATEGQSETSKSNDIPIIVGSVVGGVAVFSIIGFLIHRKRNSAAINPPTTSSFTMPDPVQPSFKNKIPWDDE